MTAAIIVGLLAAGGTYLILQRGIVRMALGFVLLGHAATTLLVAAGGVGRRGVPFASNEGALADPLPQAFALTAIVISFAITAFLLALAFHSRDVLGHDDVEVADDEVADGETADDETADARTADDGEVRR
jgi:multicomponent Na+:H+ antiporter subunit C